MSTFDLMINARNVFTADPNKLRIENAAIVVNDGIIVWLGEISDLPEDYPARCNKIIEASSGCITPGLIDCHTHLVYAGNRADEFKRRLEGESYADIAKQGGGIQSTVKATREASESELQQQSQSRLKHWLNNGVTHVEIKSGYGLNLESEMKMLRIIKHLKQTNPIGISSTLLAAHSLGPEYQNNPAYSDDNQAKQAYVQEIIDTILPMAKREGLVDAVDAFCENIAFSPSQLKPLFDAASSAGLAIKLHAEQLSNQGGSSLAADYGALSVDHLEYIDESAINKIAEAGTTAVLLPGAFYYLNETQLPPIGLLRKHQVPMAVATDCNPGSSPCTSLPLMINMACVEFGLTPTEAILGVTINAAKALGIEKQQGSLAVGKQADMVLWDIEQLEDLAYQFGNVAINWTLYQGQFRDQTPMEVA